MFTASLYQVIHHLVIYHFLNIYQQHSTETVFLNVCTVNSTLYWPLGNFVTLKLAISHLKGVFLVFTY